MGSQPAYWVWLTELDGLFICQHAARFARWIDTDIMRTLGDHMRRRKFIQASTAAVPGSMIPSDGRAAGSADHNQP